MKKSKGKEDVGELLSDIGHEFNNLLTTILANLRMAGQENLSYKARKHVDAAADFTVRAADLTHYLLELSQQKSAAPRVVEPSEVAKNLEVRVKPHLGKSKGLKVKPSLIRHRVLVDPIEFEKALIALCVNSSEAMPKYGEINVKVSGYEVDGKIPAEKKFKPGEYVLIEVADNGIGMSKTTLQKALQPLFTTKKGVEGAGMGLARVADFVQQSGGYIQIDSEYNRGTTVRILLPRHRNISEKQALAAQRKVAEELTGQGETILLVEDDANVLNVLGQGLKTRNYNVLLAEDGKTAIKIIKNEKHIDLLVTDVFLVDEISGKEVSNQFSESFPGADVVFVSGYHEDVVRKKLGLNKASEIISKPYELNTLLMKISQLLKGKRKKK